MTVYLNTYTLINFGADTIIWIKPENRLHVDQMRMLSSTNYAD